LVIVVAFFVFGFIGSLTLHWGLRPEGEPKHTLVSKVEPVELRNISYETLREQHQNLKSIVTQLEVEFSEAEVKQNINQGRARALILELQTYRDERNRLFEDLERRKQKMIEKIEELDSKITEKISLRAEQDTELNLYDVTNEMTSLLSYPHILNDQTELNTALIAEPIANHELVEQRFELMLQLTDYSKQDSVLKTLKPTLEQLNKEHDNNSHVSQIQCSENMCEIQANFTAKQPYFDYWQQWLVLLKENETTKLIQHQFHTQVGNEILGTVLISF
jgi:hypothetical protein